jgi:hypothetical protein
LTSAGFLLPVEIENANSDLGLKLLGMAAMFRIESLMATTYWEDNAYWRQPPTAFNTRPKPMKANVPMVIQPFSLDCLLLPRNQRNCDTVKYSQKADSAFWHWPHRVQTNILGKVTSDCSDLTFRMTRILVS